MNKNVTKYIFPYRAFPTEHDCDVYFHVQFFFLQKLEGLLQHHVSPFISPSPVLSQYIQFYEVRRNIKKDLHTHGSVILSKLPTSANFDL